MVIVERRYLVIKWSTACFPSQSPQLLTIKVLHYPWWSFRHQVSQLETSILFKPGSVPWEALFSKMAARLQLNRTLCFSSCDVSEGLFWERPVCRFSGSLLSESSTVWSTIFLLLSLLELVFHFCIPSSTFPKQSCTVVVCLLSFFSLTFCYVGISVFLALVSLIDPSVSCLIAGSPTSPDHKTKRQSDPTPFGFKGS